MPSVKLQYRDVAFWVDYEVIDNQVENLYIYVEGDKDGDDLYEFLDSHVIERANEEAWQDWCDLQAYRAECRNDF
jgi:hypothetical protein